MPEYTHSSIHIMGWLNKIFGGSSHKKQRSQYQESYLEDTVYDQIGSKDHQSEYEDGDTSHAAPSSSEDEERNTNVTDSDSDSEEDEHVSDAEDEQLGLDSEDKQFSRDVEQEHVSDTEDEQLATALQESLIVASPFYENYHSYQPFPYNFYTGFRVCAGCNTEIGHGRYLSCMNAVWHPECFRCRSCNLPIYNHEFSTYGNYPYHKTCYKEYYHPKCEVCNQFIPLNMNCLIEYRAHPFWSQKYCPSHELDGTPRCCSCERMESRDAEYFSHDDGRKICKECLDSAVMSTNDCEPLYHDIEEFFEGLDMKLEQQIPLLLVERPALNEAKEGDNTGHHLLPETRGLCLSEVEAVSTIPRNPRIEEDMTSEPYRFSRNYEVTAILILNGLPRLVTGTILAHEMMHAWLRLNGLPTLSHEVEEGICQVLAHMWIVSEIISLSASDCSYTSSPETLRNNAKRQFERRLADFIKHQIEDDPSIYGQGFRAGYQAVRQYGLRGTLDHIKMTGSFPQT